MLRLERAGIQIGLGLVLLGLFPAIARAEGSRDFISDGGDRPYLDYRLPPAPNNDVAGIPRQSQIRVFARAGERIELASSAIDRGGQINFRAPNGDVGSFDTICQIADINDEINQTYTPCIIDVMPGQEGVWEMEFVSPNPFPTNPMQGNPTPTPVGATWQQPTNASYVSAWDVTVRSGGVAQTGRVYADYFAWNVGDNDRALSSEVIVLTNDGFQYRVNLNGIDPFGFIFFANNKGFRNSSGDPIFRSLQFEPGGSGGQLPTSFDFHAPNLPDTADDVTHKLFINPPDASLPTSAPSASGTIDLLVPFQPPQPPQNLTFTGVEGTAGQAGTEPLGGNISFDNVGVRATATIILDIDQNGVYGDPIDRVLTSVAPPGANTVFWDGLDGLGNRVPASNIPYGVEVILATGETHFPFLDPENNPNGLIIERLTEPAASDPFRVYYDDRNTGNSSNDYSLCASGEQIEPEERCYGTPPGPRSALAGTNSIGGAHRWSDNFGNIRGMDTWANFPTTPTIVTDFVTLREADLVAVKTVDVDPATLGGPIQYVIEVRNDGPSDAIGATFVDALPIDIINATWTCVASAGSACGAASGSGDINTTLDLLNGGTATFTIDATVSTSASGSITNTAEVTRPSDVTDPDLSNNPTTATTTLVAAADLVTTKTGLTSGPLGQYTYTLETTNLGPSPASDVVIQDQIAPGAIFVSASDGGTEAGGIVSWNAGTLNAGETVTRTVTVDLTVDGSYENVASSSSTTADADPTNNDGSQTDARVTTIVPVAADLVTTKTGLTSGPLGQYTYTLETTNLGPDSAENVTVQDQVAPGATFVSASDGGTEAGGVVTWDIGTLASGQTVTRTVTVDLTVDGSYENIASSESTTADADPTNNDGSQTNARVTTIVPATAVADLTTTKTGLTSGPLGQYTYTLTATNLGPDAAENVTIQDQIAAGAIFVSASDGGTEAGGIVTWDIGTLASGQTVTRTVTVNLTVDGSYENIASGSSTTPDADPTNNDGSQADARVTTVVPAAATADLVTTKTGLTSGPLGQYTYTLETTNLGPASAENVTVQDQVASGAAFVSASDGGTEVGGVVTWDIGTLTSGQTVTRTVTVDLTVDGSYENIASSNSTTADADPSNNDGSQTNARVTTVVPAAATADLVTTKTGATSGLPGQYTYTLTATNLGPDAAENVTVQDQIAAGATFASASDGGTEAGGVVTWSLGTLNAGQTATRTVTVSLNADGSYENIASGSSTTTDADPSNNDGSQADARVTTAIATPATDVGLTKTSSDRFTPGEELVYTLTIENLGTADALNVQVEDPTPTGLAFVSNTGDCTTAFPCDLGTIPAGASRTIATTFNVPADYSGPNPIVNSATVTAANDSDTTNNNAQVSVPSIVLQPNLRLVKRITAVRRDGVSLTLANFDRFNDDPNDSNDNASGWSVLVPVGIANLPDSQPLRSGDQVQYTVYFLSDGTLDLTGIDVCDPVPDGTTFLPNSFAAGRGILANQGRTSTALTNTNDADAGQFFLPLNPVDFPCPQPSNPTGAVVLQNLNLAVDEAGFLRFWVELD